MISLSCKRCDCRQTDTHSRGEPKKCERIVEERLRRDLAKEREKRRLVRKRLYRMGPVDTYADPSLRLEMKDREECAWLAMTEEKEIPIYDFDAKP